MGKLGRFACILTPMLCTLASMTGLVLLLISGTKSNLLPSVYYVRIDVRNIEVGNVRGADDLGIDDFYSSYLWNVCGGDVDRDNKWKTIECQKPKAGFSFNIADLVKDEADDKDLEVDFPNEVKKAQKAVTVVHKFMAACYVLAAVSTIVTFIVGWFGLLSRWGSCVTTIFADVAFGFMFTASLCSTILAYALKGAFNKAFDDVGIKATVGNQWLQVTWVATAFALASSIFWMMSMCCCSGRTSKIINEKGKAKGTKVEHTGNYQRVASPYLGPSPAPYGQASTPGYEPMRHHPQA